MDITSHYRSKAGRVHRALTNNLRVGVYQSENTNEIVIAYDGRNALQLDQELEVANLVVGRVGDYYAKAYLFANAVIENPDFAGKEITFVGHSQGGAYAALMAEYFGYNAHTFNSLPAARALGVIDQEHTFTIGDQTVIVPARQIDPENQNTITAYQVKHDVAGFLGDQIGNVVEIDLGLDFGVDPLIISPHAYHQINLLRLVAAVGTETNAPSTYRLETLQALTSNELVRALLRNDLHADSVIRPDDEAGLYLENIVNSHIAGGLELTSLTADITLIANAYEHQLAPGFGQALLRIAIEGSSQNLDSTIPFEGIYSLANNAFVFDVNDPSFPLFDSIENSIGGDFYSAYRDLFWVETSTNDIHSEHRSTFNSHKRSVTEHKVLFVSADDLGANVSISENPGAALFYGNSGNDVFVSSTGDDFMYGAGGDDTLNGGAGSNTLFGGTGNDVLLGNAGAGQSDVLVGGAGNDTLSSQAGNDFLYGGAGTDVADYASHAGGVQIAFGGTPLAGTLKISGGTAGNDDLFFIEKIVGTAAQDTLRVTSTIASDTAVEIDMGGGQASTVTDLIDLSGASEAMAVQIGANGQGSIQAQDGSGGTITLTNANAEVIGSAYDDDITIDEVAATVSGGLGDDTLQGGVLNDVLSGGEDDDVVRGGGGHDTLNGGSGSNSLYGDDGNDTLIGGENTDAIWGGLDSDQLFGRGGRDILRGEDGADTLYGEGGNDYLIGGDGEDILEGGDDNDTLVGGKDADQLTGGSGADHFHVGDLDIIHDAEVGDKISFEGRQLTGATRVIKVVDGVERYETLDLIGAHNERYEIHGDVQEQIGAGIKVTIHLPGGGKVELKDFQQGDGGIELYDHIFTTTEKSGASYGQAGQLISPLVLDLDGDGVELTGLTSSQAYFDLDADGFAEKTGWVGGGDGLLALDRNADGVINDITELFGNATTDGFTELALLDSNTDGVFDVGDTEFANMRVWIDSNRDGTTDAGELKTLSELQIESISLSATEVTQTQLGNEISHISSYTRSDGSQHEIVDAWFANDQLDTRYLGDTSISAEVAALANLRGTGELLDLQVASENDAVLKGLVAELDTLQISDIATMSDKVEAILFQWAGTQDLAQDTRGPYVDSRQLVTMEKIFGQAFFQAQNANSANPDTNAGNALSAVWLQIVADTGAKLLLQSGQSGLFGGTASYDFETDLIVNTATQLDFQALAAAAPSGTADKAAYWKSLVPMIQSIASASGIQEQEYSGLLSETLVNTGVLSTLEELMISTPVSGGLGDDSLVGTSGRDLLDGGQGNDILAGGEGGDVYVFARGGGQDVINEEEDAVGLHMVDKLELLDIASNEVTLERNGDDLIIKVNGSDDQITITKQFSVANLGPYTQFRIDHEIESIIFSDGIVWDEQRIREELLTSTDGNDTLTGFFARDRLDGGLGNDVLLGGDEADTYVFDVGYGQDEIYDYMTSVFFKDADIVSFGAVITQDNITFTRGTGQNLDDLIIEVQGTSDRLTIRDNFFAGNLGNDGALTVNNLIEEFHFADASVLTDAQVREILLTSTDGDDTLNGFFGVDTLDGGLGNDELLGGDDGDTYIFGLGYGQDEIYDYMTSIYYRDPDIVRFGEGITQDNITFMRGEGQNLDDLIIEVQGTTDRLTIRENFNAGNLGNDGALTVNNLIEEFHFADASMLSDAQVREILLTSTDGDDTLIGFFGADTLDGGLGNDRLEGGNVGDTYIFDAGYGHDVIEDLQTSIFFPSPDIVSFGAGISANDLILNRTGDLGRDLTITFEGLTDTLTIENIFFTSFYEIEEFHFTNGEVWSLADVQAKLVTGTDGDDVLQGFDTADTLYGGLGNDRLEGSSNSDTYIFNAGDGQDVFYDFQSSPAIARPDIILFGAGISASDLTLTRTGLDGRDMQITFDGSSDSILIDHMLFNADFEIEEFHFADGMIWTLADIWGALLGATDGNDVIIGTGNADVLSGVAGDDTLTGKDGNDSLIGGEGNDRLHGGSGSDTYIFTRGDGVDFIEDNGYANTDRLVLHGYTPAEVTLGRASAASGDLVLTFAGTTDQITVRHALDNNVGDNIEEYIFDDDTIWTPDDLRTMILDNAQTDGDDLVHGFKTSDQLEGGLGNDELRGGDGSDDYIFTRGDGIDVIEDDGYLSTDRLVLHGYTPDEVIVTRTSATSSHALLTFAGTNDQITINNTLNGGSFDVIEQVLFDNGIVWTPADLRTMILDGTQTDGNDVIHGFSTSDQLEGGLGNDELRGGDGSDDYIFTRGDGIDVIEDDGYQATDRLVLQGYTPDEVTIGRSSPTSNNVVLTFDGTGDQITINNTLNGGSFDTIEQIVFDDTTVWTPADLRAALLTGGDSDDVLNGFQTSDTLDGGLGNDRMEGGFGGDTYIFDSGYGNDVILDAGYGSDFDKVIFGTGILASDLALSYSLLDAQHLVIEVISTGETLTIEKMFSNNGFHVELFEFADGSSWTRGYVQAVVDGADPNAPTHEGTVGNDIINGTSGDDIFAGRGGDDTLNSYGGNDTFLYASGDGSDKINEDSSSSALTDTLKFTDLNIADLTFSRVGVDLMIAVDATGHVIEVDEQFSSPSLFYGMEVIEFADGMTWDRDQIKSNAWIRGTDGADSLTGSGGDDVFVGGAGDDTIFSTGGSDTFIYASGDGSDKIDEESASTSYTDVLKLTDLNATDITLSKVGIDLMLTVTGTGHVIEIDQQFYSPSLYYGIEKIEFADGTSLNRAEMNAQATAPAQAASAQVSGDPFLGFRTLRELFGDTDPSDDAASSTGLSLADLIDEPGMQETETLESQILTLLDPYGDDTPASPGGSADHADLASLAIFGAALVMPELPAEDYSGTQ